MKLKYKNGDRIQIRFPPGKWRKTAGFIVKPVSYNQASGIVMYRVNLDAGMTVNVPDTHLMRCTQYDGDDVGNWADLRHIWRPK